MLTHFYNNDLLFNNKKTNFMQSRLDYRVSSKDSYIGPKFLDLFTFKEANWVN